MDMSKLPRLSNTAAATPPPAADAPLATQVQQQPLTYVAAEPGVGEEIWLCGVLGLVFMYLGRTFAIWFLTTISGHTYHTGAFWSEGTPLAGQEVPYTQLDVSFGLPFWTDASVFLFGLALVFEAIVLFASTTSRGLRRPLVSTAFAVTMLAIAFSLFACGKLMANGIAPIISLLALAFGVYMAMYEWNLLKSMTSKPM